MSTVHFLNVLEGDCNIIQHDSGRISVIDVSNASNDQDTVQEQKVRGSSERQAMFSRTNVPQGKVDYGQKKIPDNPIPYLKKLGISEIWRFIVTHPDMDHLDGIRDLYQEFSIHNTWDSDNTKECDLTNFMAGYNPEDWEFYLKLRNGKIDTTRRLTNFSGHSRDFWNTDHIKILCPTEELLCTANDCGDYNDSSYVILYTPPKKGGGTWKILFAGDSHDGCWEHILQNHKAEVSNIDILLAPHHGRDSNRNYDFLKTLTPTVTLFGNASSKHLAYSSYPETRITNNQAGYVIMDISEDAMNIYVKNKEFANDFRNNPKRNWGDASYNFKHEGYLLCALTA